MSVARVPVRLLRCVAWGTRAPFWPPAELLPMRRAEVEAAAPPPDEDDAPEGAE